MNKSESIKEFATAFCNAQAEMRAAKKDSKNPFFKKDYASLHSVMDAIKDCFPKYGLSYLQFPISCPETHRIGINTILLHESGEFIEQDYYMPFTSDKNGTSKQDSHACGSIIAYAKRYALQAAVGLPSEDDDGNAASNFNKKQFVTAPKVNAPEKLDYSLKVEGLPMIKVDINSRQDLYVKKCLAAIGVKTFHDATLEQKSKIITSMPK